MENSFISKHSKQVLEAFKASHSLTHQPLYCEEDGYYILHLTPTEEQAFKALPPSSWEGLPFSDHTTDFQDVSLLLHNGEVSVY